MGAIGAVLDVERDASSVTSPKSVGGHHHLGLCSCTTISMHPQLVKAMCTAKITILGPFSFFKGTTARTFTRCKP